MSNIVYLSLGSNLGERADYLREAISKLSEHKQISVEKSSSFYETEPVGYQDQPWFYNAVVKISTTLIPEELLFYTKEVENILGRERKIKWGPRTVDIDILMFNGIEQKKADLTIPHPRMLERAFVLYPLAEIEPTLVLPTGDRISEFIENFEQSEKITLVKNL